MKPGQWMHSVLAVISGMDRKTVNIIRNHPDLVLLFAALILAVWAPSFHHATFDFGLLIIGAVSYFAGIFVALVGGLLILALGVWHGLSLTNALVETIGYISVAWLGYRHKAETYMQQAMRAADPHRPQELPWSVANEIRTSLAAVRFLIFPLHEGGENNDLQKATNELSRLEQLFMDLEKMEQDGDKQSSLRKGS